MTSRLAARTACLVLLLSLPAWGQVTVQQTQKLFDPAASGQDLFAWPDLALSGDRLAVLDGKIVFPPDPERIITYTRGPLGWMPEAILDASSGLPTLLGAQVALQGDTLAVATPLADEAGPDTGAVRIYRHQGGSWIQEQVLLPADVQPGMRFGTAVALDGDTLVASTQDTQVDPVEGGAAVYVFVRQGGVWVEQARLRPDVFSDVFASTFTFGRELDLDGDTVVVGAPADAAFGIQPELQGVAAQGGPGPQELDGRFTPSVYVFVREGTVWTRQARLTPRWNDGWETGFGSGDLALEGDTLLVADVVTELLGEVSSVHVFERTGTTWSRVQRLRPPLGTPPEGYYGSSVALSGDVAMISGYGTPADSSEGAGTILVRGARGWEVQAWFEPDDAPATSQFGLHAALEGDTLVMAAFQAPVAGAVYVFELSGLP